MYYVRKFMDICVDGVMFREELCWAGWGENIEQMYDARINQNKSRYITHKIKETAISVPQEPITSPNADGQNYSTCGYVAYVLYRATVYNNINVEGYESIAYGWSQLKEIGICEEVGVGMMALLNACDWKIVGKIY